MFTLHDTQNKACSKCGLVLPLSCFSKAKQGRLGLKARCKPCMNAWYRYWRTHHGAETFIRHNRKNYEKHKNTLGYKFLRLKGLSKRRGIELSITLKDFEKMWEQRCFYCGDEVVTTGLDRVDSSKGYTRENIVRCCELCNRAKNVMSVEDFIAHCKKIVEHATN